MELFSNEAVRLASSIQPGGKPPHFQRQIDLVHCAPRGLLHHGAEYRDGSLREIMITAVRERKITA
jgi:hypothetical protein